MKVGLREIIIKKDKKKHKKDKDYKRDMQLLKESFMSDLDLKLPKFVKLPGIVRASMALMRCMFWDNFSNVFSTLLKSDHLDGRPKFESAKMDADLAFYVVKLKLNMKEDSSVGEIIKKLKSSVPVGRVSYISEKTDIEKEVILIVLVKILGSNNCGKML